MEEYFSDPLLKAVLSAYWGYLGVPPTRLTFAYLAMIFYQFTEFKPFHVRGGSQALSNAILNQFLTNGGTVKFNCAARKIMVEDGKVKGVVTAALRRRKMEEGTRRGEHYRGEPSPDEHTRANSSLFTDHGV